MNSLKCSRNTTNVALGIKSNYALNPIACVPFSGRKITKNLRDICTIHTPEQKNEAGEVTAKATSFVNHRALVLEARLVLALKREGRIVGGQRKRSSGRGSDRTMHNATVKFIDNRNKVTAENEPLKTSPRS